MRSPAYFALTSSCLILKFGVFPRRKFYRYSKYPKIRFMGTVFFRLKYLLMWIWTSLTKTSTTHPDCPTEKWCPKLSGSERVTLIVARFSSFILKDNHVATASIPVDQFEHHTMITMKIECFANYSNIETITAARVGSCRDCKYPSRSIRASYDDCDEKNASQITRKSKPSRLHEWDHVATASIPVDQFDHHTMIAMKIKCFAHYSKIETITAARMGSCRDCK